MTRDELESYITDHFAAKGGHPIAEDPTITIFMRSDNKKWFAATKNIGWRFLEAGRDGRVDILNLKLDPRVVSKLRRQEGFRPAWRMNQNNWVTVALDGSVADADIRTYLDMAFADTGASGKGRRR